MKTGGIEQTDFFEIMILKNTTENAIVDCPPGPSTIYLTWAGGFLLSAEDSEHGVVVRSHARHQLRDILDHKHSYT